MTPTDLIARQDGKVLFVISHSGGKDSQATQIAVLAAGAPREHTIVIHADLGELEWPGAKDLARKQAEDAGLPFLVARAVFLDGSPKDMFAKIEHQWRNRQDCAPFPSKNNRWCTGELKTQPIEREVRRYAKAHGYDTVVMCVGLRAQESPKRAAELPFEHLPKKSCQGRAWFQWLPIHSLSTLDVWQSIYAAGQEPHPQYGVVEVEGEHYAAANERLSCKFCIFGSRGDLCNGAKADPALLARFTEVETRTGYAFHKSRKPLAQLVADAVTLAA